ncbi:MAG: A/G-specific adenine glycosylase [Candidatus Pacebacteria bacterium]|nr:A/G-specific adenine glycosylase [Candidatus Paceibacterota bacterium]MDD5356791.1 A/G-specific adenine glycosylase [Candidatus Paceibacterota bacterium]
MKVSNQNIKKFQQTIWNYYAKNKRQMPWRETTDPYKILVSEIMLQQTQVSRVIPKYESFTKRFPTVQKLAQANMGDVLKLWQGLGYNRRALNLKRAAEMVVRDFGGEVPNDLEKLDSLPGVGAATAGAVAAYAWNKPTLFIETNIRRTFLHFFFDDADCKMVDDKVIFPFVEKALPNSRWNHSSEWFHKEKVTPREWYYALMDYGAMLKATVPNPNRRSAHYAKQSKFAGSNREVRGKILELISAKEKMSEKKLLEEIADKRCEANISALIKEGFLKRKGAIIKISNSQYSISNEREKIPAKN